MSPRPATDGPEWTDRIEWGDDGPTAREHASVMVFGDRVVVYAGSGYKPQGQPLNDAWAFNRHANTWTQLSIEGDLPTAGGSKRVSHDPASNSYYLFGGYGAGFAGNHDLHRVILSDDSLIFEKIEQESPPPERALHLFAFDAQTGRFVTGLGVSPQGFLGDTWIGEFDDEGRVVWRQIEAAPSARFGMAFGFDSQSGELIAISGQVPPTPESPMAMTDEFWVLDCRADEPHWTQVPLESAPAGRRNPTFAYDDRTDRLVIWCGTADGRTNVEGLVVVARAEDGDWTVFEHQDGGAFPKRSSGFGFVDSTNGRFYLGFGNSAEGQFRDWCVLSADSE